MTRYEYRVECPSVGANNAEELAEYANQYAAEGWRVVSMGLGGFLLEREVED